MVGIFAGLALLQSALTLVISLALLVAVSHLDDMYGLPVLVRFGVQLTGAAVFAFNTFSMSPIPQLVLIVACILWATNLYNFMDGSDGLAGGMATLGFGFLAAGAWMNGSQVLLAECLTVAAAAAVFLAFNFPPARIFMGDAGSVPLGFLAAALSLSAWHDGAWPVWFPLLVFAPFVADSSITLVKRLLAGERVWDAHNKHYYQRLIRMGWSHRRTALVEYALMFVYGITACWALGQTPYVQFAAIIGLVTVHVALAVWVDLTWRRGGGKRIGSA
jgi:UDP-GlcNAc:undecaprenyl-phosphate GlcNAc-1-phosphate transferase